MNHLHAKFLHQEELNRRLQPEKALSIRSDQEPSVFAMAQEGDQKHRPEYVEWCEQRIAELEHCCESQAEIIHRNPQLL